MTLPGVSPGTGPLVFISAAEPSADLHASHLVRRIRELRPDARFIGVAGPLTQAAGCEIIEDWTRHSAMLTSAMGLVGRAWRLLGRVSGLMREQRFSLSILVDSPALHLPMAKRIKRAGCPVLYYIAPQLWAWGGWRIGRLRRRVDRLAVILPFEQDYFRSRGVQADYVGHPLIEQLAEQASDAARGDALKTLGSPLIACLPGSRKHVVEEVLPGQIEVARRIADEHPSAGFLFAAAHEIAAERIRSALAAESLRAEVWVGRNSEVLRASDLVLCASGTATLEVAYHNVPMVVMYNGSKWGYRLVGRWLIRTPHLSLVNILAGRRIVPEFMPYYTSTQPIAAEALHLLADRDRHARVRRDLAAVIAGLGDRSAADHTAKMAIEMMGERR